MGVFQYVQQVECDVKNRDEMVAYLERNFGMKPDRLEENVRGEWVEAQYRVGEKGTKLLGDEEQGFRDGFRDASKSPHGYYETYIDPEDSLGIEFRIVHAPDSLSIDIARAPR